VSASLELYLLKADLNCRDAVTEILQGLANVNEVLKYKITQSNLGTGSVTTPVDKPLIVAALKSFNHISHMATMCTPT